VVEVEEQKLHLLVEVRVVQVVGVKVTNILVDLKMVYLVQPILVEVEVVVDQVHTHQELVDPE
tara:strand:- start:41 stop:229 length:189 start_codon:yes stop_codon:yes gene_type:complete